ncbi:MAG TPA: EVE domain-containing protein [Gemmataceae bacterium]|jgi:predicted RNA-binding protein with PUA-like domain|nr:EVE domain-containing protein [Gemmataceae bacterium]
MANWLFKEEPECYNFEQLERDGSTVWSGVANNLARKNLRQVCKGDRVLFYATGKVKAVVGEMEVIEGPRPESDGADPRSVVVTVRPVRRLQSEVTLASIKADPQLADWDLVRLSRLSVMSVSAGQWQRIMHMSQGKEAAKITRRTGPPKSPRPARKNKE